MKKTKTKEPVGVEEHEIETIIAQGINWSLRREPDFSESPLGWQMTCVSAAKHIIDELAKSGLFIKPRKN
jgi:hypothetical protein